MSAQPGWYPDPSGAPQTLRYFDGSQWTSDTQRIAGAPSIPVTKNRRRLITGLVIGALVLGVSAFAFNVLQPAPTPSVTPRTGTPRAPIAPSPPPALSTAQCPNSANAGTNLNDGFTSVPISPPWAFDATPVWTNCGATGVTKDATGRVVAKIEVGSIGNPTANLKEASDAFVAYVQTHFFNPSRTRWDYEDSKTGRLNGQIFYSFTFKMFSESRSPDYEMLKVITVLRSDGNISAVVGMYPAHGSPISLSAETAISLITTK